MEVQGLKENLVPRAHIHLLCRLPGVGDLPWGKTFISQRACTIQWCAPWPLVVVGDMSAASSSVFKPLAPPPGIPLAPGLSHYLQDPLPTSFPLMGLSAEYNFDPITGRPLKASTPNVFSWSSQPRDVLLPTFVSP